MKQLVLGELNKGDRENFVQLTKAFGVELPKDDELTKNIQVGDIFYGVRKDAQQPYLSRSYIVVSSDDITGVVTVLELSARTSMEGLNRAERLEKVSKIIENTHKIFGLTMLTLLATADDELIVIGESTDCDDDKPISVFTKDKKTLEEKLEAINRRIWDVRSIFG